MKKMMQMLMFNLFNSFRLTMIRQDKIRYQIKKDKSLMEHKLEKLTRPSNSARFRRRKLKLISKWRPIVRFSR